MPRKVQTALLVLLLAVFAAQITRLAWVSDDAYITFRSVENFIHGYGPVYNVGERVQTFTHPLWFGLLALVDAPLRLNLPLLSILLSLAAALAAAGVFAFRVASSRAAALGGVGLLLLCKAVLDYSTSGLEDALTFLLLAGFWARFFWLEEQGRLGQARAVGQLALLAALGALNRLDTVLFYLPALAWLGIRGVRPDRFSKPFRSEVSDTPAGAGRSDTPAGAGRSDTPAGAGRSDTPAAPLQWRWGAMGAGMLPLVLWEAFSLFYYGFPFPNTAYAKLNTGIPRGLLLAQGGRYALDALFRDPAVWVVILGAWLVLCLDWRRAGAGRQLLAAGMAAYVLYVVWIGGDFMAGRFWAAPVFAGVILLARGSCRGAAGVSLRPVQARDPLRPDAGDPPNPGAGTPHPHLHKEPAVVTAILALAAILIAGANPWRTLPPSEARVLPESGIVDERSWYFPRMGLFNALGGEGFPGGPAGGWVYDPARAGVRELDTIGVDGYRAGPSVYVLDRWALADPLLARLPVEDPLRWRIGHFRRRLPEGYVETLQSGRNLILNPDIARLYDRIRQVTRGPLTSPGRLLQVVRLLARGSPGR